MARTVRNQKLDTRSARVRLPVRKSIYWVSLSPGCALGYRKGPKGGVWIAKLVRAGSRQQTTLGPADDILDPDGVLAISYAEAQAKAREWFERLARPTIKFGPYTVADAMADYLTWFRDTGRKSISETETTAKAFILSQLGNEEVKTLTPVRLRKWLSDLAATPPRARTKRGRPQNFRNIEDDPESQRRRRATANRILTVLKAALNHAFHEEKVPSDDAWRRVKPFPEADAARVRYLDRGECRRLVNACSDDFRHLIRGALLTGARYSELGRMHVSDFNRESGTVFVRRSKSGKSRHIELTEEGLKYFREITSARDGEEILFQHEGIIWGKSQQSRPLAEACVIAKLSPPASFHVLRHTYASLMVMDDVPLMVLARNLGHSDTRMVEKHYGHLARSYIRDAIRSARPLGISAVGIPGKSAAQNAKSLHENRPGT